MSGTVRLYPDRSARSGWSLAPAAPGREWEGEDFELPDGFARSAGGLVSEPSGRPAGPHGGRWGGPCVLSERGGLVKLRRAGGGGPGGR